MSLPYTGDPHILSSDDVLPAEGAQRVIDKLNDASALFAAQHFAFGRKIGQHSAPPIPVALAHVKLGTVPGPDTVIVSKVGFSVVSVQFGYDASDALMAVVRLQTPARVAVNTVRTFVRIKTSVGATIARTIAPRSVSGQGFVPYDSEHYSTIYIPKCFGDYVEGLLILGFGYHRDF
jgi:hypothetical protein